MTSVYPFYMGNRGAKLMKPPQWLVGEKSHVRGWIVGIAALGLCALIAEMLAPGYANKHQWVIWVALGYAYWAGREAYLRLNSFPHIVRGTGLGLGLAAILVFLPVASSFIDSFVDKLLPQTISGLGRLIVFGFALGASALYQIAKSIDGLHDQVTDLHDRLSSMGIPHER